MYICIDFDGTICDHAYPKIGIAVPNAVSYMRMFQDAGVDIILWTVRDGIELELAVNYVKTCGINLFGINENPAQKSFSNSPKAWGHLYIDDAAYGCPLIQPTGFLRPCVNWSIVGKDVMELILK